MILAAAARPLMLSPCLATSPTDDFTSYPRQYPVSSPLHSPTSLGGGVTVVGDGRQGFLSPLNSSSGRPWPTSPTEHRTGVFQLDTWVRGSAESLVGQVSLRNLFLSFVSVRNFMYVTSVAALFFLPSLHAGWLRHQLGLICHSQRWGLLL